MTDEQKEAIKRDVLKNGPVLLWTGYGTMPTGQAWRGIVPETIDNYLEAVLVEYRRHKKLEHK